MDDKNFIQNIMEMVQKLTLQQKMMIGGGILGAVILLVFLLFAFSEPDYAVLYTDLSKEDASKIVSELETNNIPYKLLEEGTTISVPSDRVYQQRISLAGKGLPGEGVIGYEVFDDAQMGMSEYMQKLNFKRALEGEISKSIMTMEGVENVKVILVMPTRAIFKDEQKDATASVQLRLLEGHEIEKANIEAIANLVASSVEGLEPGKVTIVDARTNRLLSEIEEEEEEGAFTEKEFQLKRSVEKYYTRKVVEILDPVFGMGNTRVQLNVELDYNKVERTLKSFDPETQVEVSEQVVKSSTAGKNYSDTSHAVTENTTTNYEISNSLEHIIQGPGNIKRITVVAVIDDEVRIVEQPDGTFERVITPRDQELLDKIELMVANSIGIDDTRNDVVSVVNTSFEKEWMNELLDQQQVQPKFMDKWGNPLLMGIAIIAALFVLRGLLNRLKEEKILIGVPKEEGFGGGGRPMIEQDFGMEEEELPDLGPTLAEKKAMLSVGDLEREISDEALRRQVRQEKIQNYVGKNPLEAAKLINLWLKEGEA